VRILRFTAVCLALSVALAAVQGCRSDEERLDEFMARGLAYAKEGKIEEAIIEYKNVLQIDPNHGQAHDRLAIAYMEVEKPRESYWEMSEAVRLDPENIEARLRYGTLSFAIGDHDIAIEQANAIVELEPDTARGYVLRAQALEGKGDLDAAEEDFKTAIRSDLVGPAYQYLAMAFLERQQRYDEAEGLARALMDLEESYLAASTLARYVARENDRDEEAEQIMRRAIELALEAPEESAASQMDGSVGSTSLIPAIARADAINAAYELISAFYYDRGRLDDAIAVLEEGLDRSERKTDLVYQMARFYRLEGMDEKADQMMRRATEESPELAGPHLVLSAYLGQQGDLDGAFEAAEAAVEAEPDNRAAQLRKAELLVDRGFRDGDADSIQAGRAIVDEVLEAEPSSAPAHFVRAKIELAENDPQAAEQSLEAALQAQPDWAQARFVLGSTLAVMGDAARARVELARALELEPGMTDARKLLTRIHAQLGEDEFAIEQGRAYLKERPGDSEIRIIVGQSLLRVGRAEEAYREVSMVPEEERDAAAYFALGRLDIAFGRIQQGVERLRRADEMAPGNPRVLEALLAIDQRQGNLADSVTRVSKALEASPESSELSVLDGDVKRLQGDAEGARAAYRRGIDLEPTNLSAYANLSALERLSGNNDVSVAVMEEAAAALPNSATVYQQLGLMYEQAKRREEALAAYEKAISLDPTNALAKNNLAYLLAESGGDLDRALDLAREAKEQRPDDGNATDTLGWVLLKRGVPSAAIGYLEEASEQFPENALEAQGIVRNHLAQAYELNSEPEKALAASRESVAFFEKLQTAAQAQGVDVGERDWAQEARTRIGRLSSAS